MITVLDVLHHIAQELFQYSGADPELAIEEMMGHLHMEFHIAITDDVEETETDYMDRYGRGHTFYFRLVDYGHGKLLAGQMYWIFQGKKPDLSKYTGDKFAAEAQLYLFVHVQQELKEKDVAVALS